MDDSRIIELFLQRREEAIRETASKYGRLCRHVAMNVLGNEEDADECVNDAYLGVWNAIPPATPEFFSAFLCRLVRNAALNKADYNLAEKRNPEYEAALEELETAVGCDDRALAEAADDELRKLINTFLGGLTKESRVVFVRRYWYWDSVKEISFRTGFSQSKIKSMLLRTRNKLRAFLEKEGIEL